MQTLERGNMCTNVVFIPHKQSAEQSALLFGTKQKTHKSLSCCGRGACVCVLCVRVCVLGQISGRCRRVSDAAHLVKLLAPGAVRAISAILRDTCLDNADLTWPSSSRVWLRFNGRAQGVVSCD